VRLERAFQTPKFYALLLELCPTDLNRLLCEENEEGRCPGLDSKTCAKYMGQTLLALVFLHTQTDPIIYRDIKPENILISFNHEAKLTDFGLAKIITNADKMTMCGTQGFFPPELLDDDSGSDGSQADIPVHERTFKDPFKMDAYSFGVTLQLTLLGENGARKRDIKKKGAMMLPLPNTENENTELLQILQLNGGLSEEGFDLLVHKLLPMEPRFRCNLKEERIMAHPFFLKELGCEDIKTHLLPKPKTDAFGDVANAVINPVINMANDVGDGIKNVAGAGWLIGNAERQRGSTTVSAFQQHLHSNEEP